MKHAKALLSHMYDGKRRNVGDIYPIRRGDWLLMQKLGRIAIVPDPNQPTYRTTSMAAPKPQEPQWSQYQTAEMQAEPPPARIKRAYNRKVKPAE